LLAKPRYQSWAGQALRAALAGCSTAAGISGGGCEGFSVAHPHTSRQPSALHKSDARSRPPAADLPLLK
jgi:hypothetical protein